MKTLKFFSLVLLVALNLVACQKDKDVAPITESEIPTAYVTSNDDWNNVNSEASSRSSCSVYVGTLHYFTQAALNTFDPCITKIEGDLIINPSNITDFSPLQNLEEVTGWMRIWRSQATTLHGLENLHTVGSGTGVLKNLIISDNDLLTSLDGLSGLQYVGGDLTIWDNALLPSLEGMEGLTTVGGSLTIENNTVLSDCCPIISLISSGVSGTITLAGNAPSCNGTLGSTYVGDVIIYNQTMLDDFDPCITKIDGYLNIIGAITDLSALANLTEVTGSVNIQNTSITDLSGLDKLKTVGTRFRTIGNHQMTSLSGIDNLTVIGGDLAIIFNSNLTDCCPIQNLIGGTGVGGTIVITHNQTGCSTAAQVQTATCP